MLQMMDEGTNHDLSGRNRRVRRVLLIIVAVLIVATLLVGIRW